MSAESRPKPIEESKHRRERGQEGDGTILGRGEEAKVDRKQDDGANLGGDIAQGV